MSAEVTADPTVRRARLRRNELRDLLLEAGQEIIAEEGMGAAAGSLTFRKVFDRIEREQGLRFSNASVIGRIWKNLADYRSDVLASTASEFVTGELDAVAEVLFPLLEETDLRSPAQREVMFNELLRLGGAAAMESSPAGSAWVPWLGVLLSQEGTEAGTDEVQVRAAATEAVRQANLQWEEVFGAMLDLLGYRLRAGFELANFAWTVGMLTDGFVIARAMDEEQSVTSLPTGPGGALRAWSTHSLALRAVAEQYFEPDPEWTPADTPTDAVPAPA